MAAIKRPRTKAQAPCRSTWYPAQAFVSGAERCRLNTGLNPHLQALHSTHWVQPEQHKHRPRTSIPPQLSGRRNRWAPLLG